jgi:hypothetical protein
VVGMGLEDSKMGPPHGSIFPGNSENCQMVRSEDNGQFGMR